MHKIGEETTATNQNLSTTTYIPGTQGDYDKTGMDEKYFEERSVDLHRRLDAEEYPREASTGS